MPNNSKIVPQYLERVEKFFKNSENRVLHLDDLINKHKADELDYVLKFLLQDSPKAAAQIEVAYFQGAPFSKPFVFKKLCQVLLLKNIWSINLGEIEFSREQLDELITVLKQTHVTHLFAELEGCHNQEWKLQIRDAIRENRKKHDKWKFKPDDQTHNQTIVASTKNWFNAINHSVNQEFLRKYGGPGGEQELQRRISLKQNRVLPWVQDRVKFQFEENGPFERGQVSSCIKSKLKPGHRVLLLDSKESATCFFGEFNFLADDQGKYRKREVACEKFTGKSADGSWVGFWTWDLPRKGDYITFRNTYDDNQFVPAQVAYRNSKRPEWFGVSIKGTNNKMEKREVIITNRNMGIDWHFSQPWDATRVVKKRLPRVGETIKALRPDVDPNDIQQVQCEVISHGRNFNVKQMKLADVQAKVTSSAQSDMPPDATSTLDPDQSTQQVGAPDSSPGQVPEAREYSQPVDEPLKPSAFRRSIVYWLSSVDENGNVAIEVVGCDKRNSKEFVRRSALVKERLNENTLHLWNPKSKVAEDSLPSVVDEATASTESKSKETVEPSDVCSTLHTSSANAKRSVGSTHKVIDDTTAPTKDDETTTPTNDDVTTAPTIDGETTAPTKDDETTAPTKDDEITAPTTDHDASAKADDVNAPEKAGEAFTPTDHPDDQAASPTKEQGDASPTTTVTASDESLSCVTVKQQPAERFPRTGLFRRSGIYIAETEAAILNQRMLVTMKRFMKLVQMCDRRKRLFFSPLTPVAASPVLDHFDQDGCDIVRNVEYLRYALLPSRLKPIQQIGWQALAHDIDVYLDKYCTYSKNEKQVYATNIYTALKPLLNAAMRIDYTVDCEAELVKLMDEFNLEIWGKPHTLKSTASIVESSGVDATSTDPRSAKQTDYTGRSKRKRKKPDSYIYDARTSTEVSRELRKSQNENKHYFVVEFENEEIGCLKLTLDLYGKNWCFEDDVLDCERKKKVICEKDRCGTLKRKANSSKSNRKSKKATE